jgi:hypothetical protein
LGDFALQTDDGVDTAGMAATSMFVMNVGSLAAPLIWVETVLLLRWQEPSPMALLVQSGIRPGGLARRPGSMRDS